MIKASFHFPQNTLWGTATAAHQVEGNNRNNNWWAWEQEENHILEGHKSGLACDWWNGRWREDFDRAANGNQNAHRLSIEWSRIQPTPDSWDEDALTHYREMLRGLRERGLTAMVTLHHFTDPLWLTERGGWESTEAIPLFETFVRKVVDALKEDCSLWCTINEPNVYALSGYVNTSLAAFPPGKRDTRLAFRVMANLVRGHAAAYHAIHEIQPESQVGFANNYRSFKPLRSWSPLDRMITRVTSDGLNISFPSALATGVMWSPFGPMRIPQAKGTQDYFGFNYYTRQVVSFDIRSRTSLLAHCSYAKGADMSEMGFLANEPEGMFEGLKWIVRTFPGLPIFITENGVEDGQDTLRPRYLVQHVHQMWRAVNFNWPVKGYFHWSLVDNFEWERGWTQRFGLWALNTDTQERIQRPSARLYAEICQENGITSDMVDQYCPEVYGRMFPG